MTTTPVDRPESWPDTPARPPVRAVSAVAALLALPVVAAADPRADLLAEYERPGAALLHHYRAVRSRDVVREPTGTGGTRVTTAESLFDREHCRVDGRVRSLDASGHPAGIDLRTVEVRNRRYSFQVRPGRDGGYGLERYAPHAERPDPWCPLLFPVADAWVRRTYLDLFGDPSTAVLGVRRQDWRGRPVVAVEVEFPLEAGPSSKRVRAVYCLAPELGWACVGDWAVPAGPGAEPRYESVYQYAVRDGWPVPTRKELWRVEPGSAGPGRVTRVVEIEEYEPVPPPDEGEFQLSAFGLPEPVDMGPPTPARGWLRLFLATAAFLLVTAAFVTLKRRAGRRVAP